MRAIVGLAAVAGLMLTGCDVEDAGSTDAPTPENTRAEEAPKEPSTEEKLATLFGGDETAIGNALDRAERHCPGEGEDRDRIADYITVAMQELDEKKPGHGEDALTIAEAIADSAEAADGMIPCSEVAATLLVLMLPGAKGSS